MVTGRSFYVYLLTNWNNRVIYVGVTNDLERRLYEHKNKLVEGFTAKYNVKKLVYFEETGDVAVALTREKEIKKWRREKKDRLVVRLNPDWKDLSSEWVKDFSLRSNDRRRDFVNDVHFSELLTAFAHGENRTYRFSSITMDSALGLAQSCGLSRGGS